MKNTEKRNMLRKKKSINYACALLVGVMLLTGCGVSNSSEYYAAETFTRTKAAGSTSDVYESMAVEAPEEAYADDMSFNDAYSDNSFNEEVAEASKQNLKNRKLITTENINCETEEFDLLVPTINKRIEELGGYIQNSNLNKDYRELRTLNYTIRVPEENLSALTSVIDNTTNITYRSSSVEDITLSYYDVQSRKEVYKTEEKRLLEMLDEAEDVETLLAVETRLAEVQAEIESMESTLRNMDNQCSYSTVYLNISEVMVYTPVDNKEQSTFEKIKIGFMASLKDVGYGIKEFFVGLIINIPYLLLIAAVIAIIVLIIKCIIKGIVKSMKKKQEKRIAEKAEAKDNSKNENLTNGFGEVGTKASETSDKGDKQ